MRRSFTIATVLLLAVAFGILAFHHHPADGQCDVCKALSTVVAITGAVCVVEVSTTWTPLRTPALRQTHPVRLHVHSLLRAPPLA
jgi:hypothetical protein